MNANLHEAYSAAVSVAEPRRCLQCNEPYQPRALHQLFCSERCRYRCRDAGSPDTVRRSRERFAAWHERVRGPVKRPNAWLRGAPPYHEHLPGGGFAFTITPALRWPLEVRNARLLHGLWTELSGIPHADTMPMFTLIPTATGRTQWSVWLSDEAVARRLAGRAWPGRIADQSVMVACGQLARPRAPKIAKRGHQRIRIDCLTPVLIRSMGSTVCRVDPTAGNLLSTLAAWLPRRLGLEIGADALRLKITDKRTETVQVDLGGKFGRVRGFQGWLELEVNAPARWLLEVAGRGLGLGGRTAFGFGRIKVSDAAQ